MAVRLVVRKDRKGTQSYKTWHVNFVWRWPDGTKKRIRHVSPVQTKIGAQRFEQQLRLALMNGTYQTNNEEVKKPTLEEFATEFLSTYAKTNNKPSEVASKESILRVHLVPFFGAKRLDQIGMRDIDRFKGAQLDKGLSPKTVNNHLTVLRKLLSVAVDYRLIEGLPRVVWLKTTPPPFDFFDFGEAERLVVGADAAWKPMIVTALKTGMRLGELLALTWDDVDLRAGRIVVRGALSRGVITTPKSNKTREIPLSSDAVSTLAGHRHLRGDYVFCREDGSLLSKESTKWPLWRACKRAGLRRIGWHTLRHTFASHRLCQCDCDTDPPFNYRRWRRGVQE